MSLVKSGDGLDVHTIQCQRHRIVWPSLNLLVQADPSRFDMRIGEHRTYGHLVAGRWN